MSPTRRPRCRTTARSREPKFALVKARIEIRALYTDRRHAFRATGFTLPAWVREPSHVERPPLLRRHEVCIRARMPPFRTNLGL